MRLAYKREEFVFLYERLVKKAEHRFAKGEYSKSIKCIESAAYFQYLFNDRYSDNRLNSILKDISSKLYEQQQAQPQPQSEQSRSSTSNDKSDAEDVTFEEVK